MSEAAAIGNEILSMAGGMSVRTSENLEFTTQDAMRKIKWERLILAGTMHKVLRRLSRDSPLTVTRRHPA